MTIKFNERAAFTLLLLAFAVLMFAMTLGLGRVARLVPLAVVVPTLVVLAAQLLLDVWPRLARAYARLEARDLFSVESLRARGRPAATIEALSEAPAEGGEWRAFLWLALLPPLAYLFGFAIGLPLYVFLYCRWRGGAGWLAALAMAAALGGLLYGGFSVALGIGLYEGELWSWSGVR